MISIVNDYFYQFVLVGKPIRVEQNPHPTKEEVDAVHGAYLDNLQNLFEENKNKYGYSGKILEFL